MTFCFWSDIWNFRYMEQKFRAEVPVTMNAN